LAPADKYVKHTHNKTLTHHIPTVEKVSVASCTQALRLIYVKTTPTRFQ